MIRHGTPAPVTVALEATREPLAPDDHETRATLLRHRVLLADLLASWTSAAEPGDDGGDACQLILSGVNRPQGHAIVETFPHRGRIRLWRTDGVRNDRRLAEFATGGTRTTMHGRTEAERFRLVLRGRPAPSRGVVRMTARELAADTVLACGQALATLDAMLAPTGAHAPPAADLDDVRGCLIGIAHEALSRHPAATGRAPRPTRLTALAAAPSPWSAAGTTIPREAVPGMRRTRTATRRDVPAAVLVSADANGSTLTMRPFDVTVDADAQPIARLRALADLEAMAPIRKTVRQPRATTTTRTHADVPTDPRENQKP